MKKRILVTGSNGLIGSEVCIYFARQGCDIHGMDNNQRAAFFGPQGDTRWNQRRLIGTIPDFQHHELDIRDRQSVLAALKNIRPKLVVHTAAIPFDDFSTNAEGTLNLLEASRQSCPESPFVHMSTNKVYSDRPNTSPLKACLKSRVSRKCPGRDGFPSRPPARQFLRAPEHAIPNGRLRRGVPTHTPPLFRHPLTESDTRWDYAGTTFKHCIPEDFPIDQSLHSLYGASLEKPV